MAHACKLTNMSLSLMRAFEALKSFTDVVSMFPKGEMGNGYFSLCMC